MSMMDSTLSHTIAISVESWPLVMSQNVSSIFFPLKIKVSMNEYIHFYEKREEGFSAQQWYSLNFSNMLLQLLYSYM